MARIPSQTANARRKRLARAVRRGQTTIEGMGPYVKEVTFSQREAPEDEVLFTYEPTKTSWPGNGWNHRRTDRAGYNRTTQTLRVQFHTNGAIYDYYDVPPTVARAFYRGINGPGGLSTGRFINSVLNNYEYERIN
jgi:KTSC domain